MRIEKFFGNCGKSLFCFEDGHMNKALGIFLIMLAAASFGLIPLFAKTAYANGFNPFTFSLFRSAFASVQIFIFLKLRDISFEVEGKQYLSLFKASLIGYCLMMVTLFMSFNYMSTGWAMALHFIYPVATMVGAVVFFKEKVFWGKIVALIVSLLGIYFLVAFSSLNSFNLVGVVLALASGVFYAYYVLVAAYGNINTLNPFVLAFYISLFNTYILFLGSLVTGNLDLQYTYTGLLSTVLVALAGNLVGMALFQAGLKVVGPTTATILSTFEPITSLIIGILVLGEILAWYHIIGSVLIIASVIILALTEKGLHKQDKIGTGTILDKRRSKQLNKNL